MRKGLRNSFLFIILTRKSFAFVVLGPGESWFMWKVISECTMLQIYMRPEW